MAQIEGGVAKRSLFNIARVNWIVFMHGLRRFLFYPPSLIWRIFGRHESDDMVHGDCYGFMWFYHAPCCATWIFCKDFYCYIKKQPNSSQMKAILIFAIAVLTFTACTKQDTIEGSWSAYSYSNDGNVTQPSFVLELLDGNFVLRSTVDEQLNTGTYHVENGVLYLNFSKVTSEFNIVVQDNDMTLSNEHEIIKLRKL